MVIDFHTHIFPPWVKENRSWYIDSDACFASLYSSSDAILATAEDLIASMDEEGIETSVALNIGWTTNELCVETNDYIMESVARYSGRLVGFGTILPRASDAALAEIERCAAGGIRGIGEMRPDAQSLGPDTDEVMKSLVEVITGHNLVMLVHASEPVGHRYPGKGTITPDVLYPLITTFPDLTLVCAHWGGGLPFYALMPEVEKSLGSVFFDTAASPFLYSPQIYHQVLELVGAEKILFGSDYPLLAPGRLLDQIKSLELPADTEELILSSNARRLLGI
jgi:hypothetical protein